MRFIPFINKKITMGAAFLLAVCTASAQDAAAAEKTVVSNYNQLATLLVVMTVVLAFVIWGLGQVLVILSRQVMEKSKSLPKAVIVTAITGLLFLSQSVTAQDATAVVKEVPNYGGLSSTTFYFFLITVLVEVAAILFLAFSIRRVYMELMPQKADGALHKSAIGSWWAELDKKLFTKAVPVEKEADVLLDHDYDGIKELDNALPPWWKYGFYITIALAFVYIGYFHGFGSGKSPFQEYSFEMDKAKAAKAAFDAQNKDKIDEANVPMADAAGIKAGQVLFEANCVACHGKEAAGTQNPPSVGPNLTDEYWLHKGSLNDIYATIKNGYPDKGMQSWSGKFNPKEMSLLASYIKSLKGKSAANAKAPQGEIYNETAVPAAADSATAAKITVAVKDTAKLKAVPAK